jgi:hypothetical protein
MFRAGDAVGRNLDVIPGAGGLLLGGAAGAGAGGYLGGTPGAIAGGLEGVISGQAHAYPVKEGSAPPAATGIRRGFQLVTGSRARAMGREAAGYNASAQKNFKDFVATGKGQHEQDFMKHHQATRATRAAEAVERQAVGKARKDVGTAAIGVGTGGLVGGAALSDHQKTAGVVNEMAATVAAGTKTMRKSIEATARSGKPMLSRNSKLVGGGTAVGLGGAGIATAGDDKPKVASLSPEREQQIKEAFGSALMAGLKGAGQFAQTAAKGIAGAGRAGGVQAAGQAAANAGRAGMHRAGNFIAQNPGAGAAMVAAPALAAGYAAGRQ